jgi:hypothetical protein
MFRIFNDRLVLIGTIVFLIVFVVRIYYFNRFITIGLSDICWLIFHSIFLFIIWKKRNQGFKRIFAWIGVFLFPLVFLINFNHINGEFLFCDYLILLNQYLSPEAMILLYVFLFGGFIYLISVGGIIYYLLLKRKEII